MDSDEEQKPDDAADIARMTQAAYAVLGAAKSGALAAGTALGAALGGPLGAAVGALAFGKGAPVAGAALFVRLALLAQKAAERGELFRIIAELVFRAVVNADLDARQGVKIMQELPHFGKVIFLHIRKLRYEITICLYK